MQAAAYSCRAVDIASTKGTSGSKQENTVDAGGRERAWRVSRREPVAQKALPMQIPRMKVHTSLRRNGKHITCVREAVEFRSDLASV